MMERSRAEMLGAVAISGLLMGPALGQSHGAHVHGIGGLDIVIEGTRVEMELELSGRDVVGFEHAPSTQKQKDAVREAAEKLKNSALLFEFPKDAGCSVGEVSVESELLDDDGDDHAHGHKDGHKDEHGHGDEHGDEHAEFHAHYTLDCANPKALDGLELLVFKAFPATEAIKVRVISPRGQKAREVHPEAARVTF